MTEQQNPIIKRYLAEFQAGLKAMPEADRAEVVQEIESHIAEAVDSGRSLAEVLERLGPAERLARAYTADALLGGGNRPVRNWFKAAAVLMLSSLTTLFVIPVLGLFSVIMPVVGGVSLFSNVVYYFYPISWIPHTVVSTINSRLLLLFIGEVASVVLLIIGIVSFMLLKCYVRLLTRTVRAALH